MTRKQLKARRAAIVAQLAKLSHKGWPLAKPYDYLPLESELRHIELMLQQHRDWWRSRKVED